MPVLPSHGSLEEVFHRLWDRRTHAAAYKRWHARYLLLNFIDMPEDDWRAERAPGHLAEYEAYVLMGEGGIRNLVPTLLNGESDVPAGEDVQRTCL